MTLNPIVDLHIGVVSSSRIRRLDEVLYIISFYFLKYREIYNS